MIFEQGETFLFVISWFCNMVRLLAYLVTFFALIGS